MYILNQSVPKNVSCSNLSSFEKEAISFGEYFLLAGMIIPDVPGTGIGVLSPETAAKISGFTSEISDTSIAPGYILSGNTAYKITVAF